MNFFSTSSNRIAIELQGGDASPIITNNTLGDDLDRNDFGIDINVSTASGVQVKNNTIACSGGDAPLRIRPGVFGASFTGDISGNTFGCDLSSTQIQLLGTLTDDTTLAPLEGQSTFLLSSTLTIPAGLTLTVPAGIAMESVGRTIRVNGQLSAAEAAFTGVRITVESGGVFNATQTSFTNTSSWITYNVGSSGSVIGSTFNDTSCLTINDASPTITGNTFNNVRSGICVNGTLIANPAMPVISNNTLTVRYRGIQYSNTTANGTVTVNTIGFSGTGSSRIAIDFNGGTASPTIDNNTILDDIARNDFGIDIEVDAESTIAVTNNTIACSEGDAPLRVTPGALAQSFTGDISGNTFGCDLSSTQIQLLGTLTDDTTLAPLEGQSTQGNRA